MTLSSQAIVAPLVESNTISAIRTPSFRAAATEGFTGFADVKPYGTRIREVLKSCK